MKVIAYTALHYGTDYLGYAIQSIIDQVDEYYVLYSKIGSHGHRTNEHCPDSRADLYAIAHTVAGNKLRWIDGEWPYEGAQRDAIHTIAPDAEVVIVLDADEVWPEGILSNAIRYVDNSTTQRWRVPFVHYWRSFYRCVLHDPAFPIRIIKPHAEASEKTLPTKQYINHMGYAQRSEIVRYKLLTHGHKNEFRRDVDWFRDIFMANRQTDCHLVGSEWWNPETVNPWNYLPEFMKSHPYANLEVIP